MPTQRIALAGTRSTMRSSPPRRPAIPRSSGASTPLPAACSARRGSEMTIKTLIRTIPHYPHQGIMFRDITTLLKDPTGMRLTIEQIVNRYKGQKISKVAGIESRGFIIGAPVAYLLGVGFVPIRKKGKLP